jgi:hypothetical protein
MTRGVGDRFVECFRGHFELVRGVVPITDNDGAEIIQYAAGRLRQPVCSGELCRP